MKIFNRETFMELPEGTIFCKGKDWFPDGLCVKGETISSEGKNIDWLYLDLCRIQASNDSELDGRLEEMLEKGTSYPMQDAWSRDGCFDKDDTFLVFERDDLKQLQKYIHTALEEMKDDPN